MDVFPSAIPPLTHSSIVFDTCSCVPKYFLLGGFFCLVSLSLFSVLLHVALDLVSGSEQIFSPCTSKAYGVLFPIVLIE